MIVYFVKPIAFDGPIKIGYTREPSHRLKTLMAWAAFPLEMIAEYAGDIETEGRFHRMFFNHISHGEWFNPAPELLDTIERIKDGTFTDDMLPPYAGVLKGMAKRLETYTEIDFEYLQLCSDADCIQGFSRNSKRFPLPSVFSGFGLDTKHHYLTALRSAMDEAA